MRDLALDPVTHDLALNIGRGHLTSDDEAVAQRLLFRLGKWRGENNRDLLEGIAYREILGQKNNYLALSQTLKRAITSSPGVDALLRFSLTQQADRSGQLAFSVRTVNGTIIDLGPFTMGNA